MASGDVPETMRAVQPPLTFGSVCSGIEAASAAWEPLGWQCLWLAEIDKAASAVLAHHFPDVPNLGDLVALADRMLAGEIEPPDVLIGGTPCQTFSIAGLRGGMADPRGALTLAFVRLADAIDVRREALGLLPVIIVWENVPGVLSHKENPFGCFLGALCGEDLPLVPSGKRWTYAGYVSGPQRTIAWRVFDAQYFGLAQRRNRTFVVASADPGCDTASILFECEGVRRDSPPSREAGETITHPIIGSLTGSGRGVARPGETRGQDPVIAVPVPPLRDGRPVAQTLDAVLHKGQTMPEKNRFPAVLQPWTGEICPTLRAGGNRTGGDRPPGTDVDTIDSLIVFDTTQLTHPANRSVPKSGDPCHPLAAGGHPPAIAFNSKAHGGDAMVECSPTLRASGSNRNHDNGGSPPAVSFTCSEMPNGFAWERKIYPTLKAHPFNDSSNIQEGVRVGMRVRRVMPVECERLQGFPDHWTLVAAGRNAPKIQADGPRYKQLGNSMAVPVIRWLGQRIQAHRSA